jgi:trk system potassium uptake protein TrkA
MNILIMGCGRVGATLAERFAADGNDVTVIDINQDAFLRLRSDALLTNHTLVGDGTDPSVLERAGIRAADVFIAVTNGDNRNIMAAQIVQRHFQVPRVICRIYDARRHEIYKKLGIESICPTLIGTDTIYNLATKQAPTALPQGR